MIKGYSVPRGFSWIENYKLISNIRWPITATGIRKRNTVNKENLTNQKILLTYKKGLLSYKQDLLTYTKKYSPTYTKNPRQIATANSHGKFLRQILAVNSHGKFSDMQYKRWCGASSLWESFIREYKKKTSNKAKAMKV